VAGTLLQRTEYRFGDRQVSKQVLLKVFEQLEAAVISDFLLPS